MKTVMKRIWMVTGMMCLLCFAGYAQIPPPPPPAGPPTQAPLDGGIVLLAVAGAAYGAKKVYNKKAKK